MSKREQGSQVFQDGSDTWHFSAEQKFLTRKGVSKQRHPRQNWRFIETPVSRDKSYRKSTCTRFTNISLTLLTMFKKSRPQANFRLATKSLVSRSLKASRPSPPFGNPKATWHESQAACSLKRTTQVKAGPLVDRLMWLKTLACQGSPR
jgi:hypothetical protein